MTNELLNMEQLDTVAGGGSRESLFDYFLLMEYGLMDGTVVFTGKEKCMNIFKESWLKAGITCIPDRDDWNEYYMNINGVNKKISREEAHEYVKTHYKSIRGN